QSHRGEGRLVQEHRDRQVRARREGAGEVRQARRVRLLLLVARHALARDVRPRASRSLSLTRSVIHLNSPRVRTRFVSSYDARVAGVDSFDAFVLANVRVDNLRDVALKSEARAALAEHAVLVMRFTAPLSDEDA